MQAKLPSEAEHPTAAKSEDANDDDADKRRLEEDTSNPSIREGCFNTNNQPKRATEVRDMICKDTIKYDIVCIANVFSYKIDSNK